MRVLFVAMSYVFPFSTVFQPCVPVIGRGQEGRGGGMRGSQNLPVCFLFPAFLKGINPWARCHLAGLEPEARVYVQMGRCRKGWGRLPSALRRFRLHLVLGWSLSVVTVWLWLWAHLGFGAWTEAARCGEGFTNTLFPQETGLGPQSLLYTGLRERLANIMGFGLLWVSKSEIASWYTIQMSMLGTGNKKYSCTLPSFLFHF